MADHALNLAWVLICAFLVMFMQLGFAMVETGFSRTKNAVHTMAMNLVIYPVGVVGFWLTGYAIDGPSKDVISAAANLQSHATSNVANVSQAAALAAVSGDLEAVHELRESFDRRRLAMPGGLSTIPGVACATPIITEAVTAA